MQGGSEGKCLEGRIGWSLFGTWPILWTKSQDLCSTAAEILISVSNFPIRYESAMLNRWSALNRAPQTLTITLIFMKILHTVLKTNSITHQGQRHIYSRHVNSRLRIELFIWPHTPHWSLQQIEILMGTSVQQRRLNRGASHGLFKKESYRFWSLLCSQ